MSISRLCRSWPVLTLFAIAVVACGTDASGSGDSRDWGSSPASEEIVQVQVSSKAVVIGTFSGDATERIIPGRDPNNPEAVDPDEGSFGSVYGLEIDRYLMGDGPNSLDLYQWEGSMSTRASTDGIRVVDSEPAGPAPLASQRYLLFIRAHRDNPELFSGTAQPWRFILADGMAKPDSSSSWILDNFPSESEADFIARVEVAIRGK